MAEAPRAEVCAGALAPRPTSVPAAATETVMAPPSAMARQTGLARPGTFTSRGRSGRL